MRRDDPGPYSLETLTDLAVPTMFTTSAETWKARLVAWFEAEAQRTLYPMQIEMLLIEAMAYALGVLGEEGQMVAEQHLVARAREAGLTVLGPNRSTPRLDASKARTTIRFSIVAASPINVLVPERTRVSGSAAGVLFLTLAPAVIAAGALFADVTAEAEIEGETGNGWLPGQLSIMLDPVAGVSASNTVAAEGGADIEDLELWRLRVANAFERISPGGGLGWYTETAIGVSSAIVDVAVIRPEPCYVDIYPLTLTGAAGLALRDQVKAAFDTREALEIRFGDEVTVKAAVAVPIAPVLTLRLRGATAGAKAVAAARANDVLTGWSRRLAAAVAPSEIEDQVKAGLKAAGFAVADIEIAEMPFEQLAAAEFAAPALIAEADIVVEALDG